MCNLYSLNKKRDAVARFFRVSHNRSAAYEPASAIFPRHVAPVVRESADGEREIITMSWGFMLLQKERAPRMPVLLTREEEFETWLRGSTDEALSLAREYPPEQTCIVQEGFEKEDLLAAA
jgi:putative SOS response-associated peptidase YedK